MFLESAEIITLRLQEFFRNWKKCWDTHADNVQGTELLVSIL